MAASKSAVKRSNGTGATGTRKSKGARSKLPPVDVRVRDTPAAANDETVAEAIEARAIVPTSYDGDALTIVTTPDGEQWAVLARLCEPFGVGVQAQWDKLIVLPWAVARIILVADSRGVLHPTCCLHLRSIGGWLFTLNVGKVAADVRPKLIRYQQGCADHLADLAYGKRQPLARARRQHRRIAGAARRLPAGPPIGEADAKLHILDPLLGIARLKATALGRQGDAVVIATLRAAAESDLRHTLDYKYDLGATWARFPKGRLEEAEGAIARMLHDVQLMLGVSGLPPRSSATMQQTALPLEGAA